MFAGRGIGYGGNTQITGSASWTYATSTSWTCPAGVHFVDVVCVGGGGGGAVNGGGGGGGALAYLNNIPVVPGTAYSVVVGAGGIGGVPLFGINPSRMGGAGGNGGNSSFGSFVIAGGGSGSPYTNGYNLNPVSGSFGAGGAVLAGMGGNGGDGGSNINKNTGGGGGAGGYFGPGGNGASGDGTGAGIPGYDSTGGGGGGGGLGEDTSYGYSYGSGGGGVGILSAGVNGLGGNNLTVLSIDNWSVINAGGSGGSGGYTGGVPAGKLKPSGGTWDQSPAPVAGDGGGYGGGGGGKPEGNASQATGRAGNGAVGAVRIIWGMGRDFPSTNTSTP